MLMAMFPWASLDHLIRSRQHRERDREAEPGKGSSFCGGGVSSAFEIGGIGEPLTLSTHLRM
jgi:hypothetical protein